MLVIGAFTAAESTPAIAQTLNAAIALADNPSGSSSRATRQPVSAPTDNHGIKMPPGKPLPKLVLVKSSFTTSSRESIASVAPVPWES